MMKFAQGQRWVVDSEPELGLGIVTAIEGRSVKIFFEIGACERLYALQNAPLTRIEFSVDDEIHLADGSKAIVTKVHEQNGILIYETDTDALVTETSLASEIKLNQPFLRLMTGQLDKPLWFYFKRELNAAVAKCWQSRLNGLLGVRANLIPHQLYVAWSACERENVRVLLADEVGLGKTIEAGMILSRLLKQERISRALIIVPDALQVQWLVELVRRFSIKPDLYRPSETGDEGELLQHDFDGGQIHIVPHSAIAEEAERLAVADFDLVIVDEAHHILPGQSEFSCLEKLSDNSKHLVLLTATPEQLGVESHFARLQLLDKAKFNTFEEFTAQEEKYIELNNQINSLAENKQAIADQYQLELNGQESDADIIDQLLDYHGIGRVMFRNVRSAISGFPSRKAQAHVLEKDDWEDKFEWLGQWIKPQKSEKILVICHSIQQVFECEQYLWKKHGIDAAVFHEEQNLIDRDRAAAYFSDMEGGAQILICSEIGSEGRNFQFSCNLVCLDLPTHPDVLEQRIGRLDRIGQTRDINIHIPFAKGSETEAFFVWYHEILECIDQQNPAASIVHDEFWPQIQGDLSKGSIIEEAREKLVTLREEIKQGRDALLEKNSCRQPQANELAGDIETFEASSPFGLVELASDLLQFHFEETHPHCYSLIPSDKMLIPSLPGIPPEGTEVTFDREIANRREDLLFITWDSPFIYGLWELLHHSDLGSASVATLASKQLPAGHCLLETCFDIVVQSEFSADARPFLPSLALRTLKLDISDKNLAQLLPEDSLQNSLQKVDKHIARQIIQSKKDEIPVWFKQSEALAETQQKETISQAIANTQKYFSKEIARLEKLAKKNPSVSNDEIEALRIKAKAIEEALNHQTHIQLSAIRLIVITD